MCLCRRECVGRGFKPNFLCFFVVQLTKISFDRPLYIRCIFRISLEKKKKSSVPSCGFSNSKIKQEKKREATNDLKNTKETYLEMSVFIVINIYR